MTDLCIPKLIRDDIIYLLQSNQDEHNHMATEIWHEAHERLIRNSGLDIGKWQVAQRAEFGEHQKAVEFIYSIPVCGSEHHSLPDAGEWWSLRNNIGVAKDKANSIKEHVTVDEEKKNPLLAEAVSNILSALTEASAQAHRIDPTSLPWPRGKI